MKRYPLLLAICCIPYVVWLVFWCRPDLYVKNIEATWHVIATVNSLYASSITRHFLLPTVTLGHPMDQGISWGAAAATDSGHFIYTSFYSPVFILAAIARILMGFMAPFESIVLVNIVLGLLSVGLTFRLVYKVLRMTGISESSSGFSAFWGSLLSLYCRETLISHGLVYWAQSVSQVLLGLLLINLVSCLELVRTSELKKFTWCTIFGLTYLFGLFEWTGILFGFAAAALFFSFQDSKFRYKICLALFLGSLASLLTILFHYSLAVGFNEFVQTSFGRFGSRSGSSGSLIGLAYGYLTSYGPWLFAVLLAFLISKRPVIKALHSSGAGRILLLASLPLLENLLMLQHATEFSFDRLKAVYPLAILLSLSLALAATYRRRIIVVSIVISTLLAFAQHKVELDAGQEFAALHRSNVKLVTMIADRVNKSCASYSSTMKVRGYDNVVVGRSIREYQKSPELAYAAMREHGGCQSVWIDGFQFATDIPVYRKAVISGPSGSAPLELMADSPVTLIRPPGCRTKFRRGGRLIDGLWSCYSSVYWPLPDPLRTGTNRL